MRTKRFFFTISYILWGLALVWGAVYANYTIYQAISKQPHNIFVNDILSDAVLLFLGFMPILWAPRFFGYQVGFSIIVGLGFGYSRARTGSIYPAIILHALFNLAGTL